MNISLGSQKVKCMKFVKPVVIHPLRWTTDFDMFLLDTVNYYLTHWNSVTKKSDNPFMVLCTNATICEMIFRAVRHFAPEEGKDRLHGLWASNKEMCGV
jgi:hypothetical protein